MPAISPLLRSSLEVLEHSLWHYFRSDTSTDRRFALLHLDQAVELVLKERIRKFGISIYRRGNKKETIGSWEAYEILEHNGCKVVERADLELLHDDRNEIQHRYSTPSPVTAVFHMENALRFVKRFMRDEFGLELEDYLPKEYVTTVLGK